MKKIKLKPGRRCHDVVTHSKVGFWYIIDDPQAYTGARTNTKAQSCFHSMRFTKEHAEARKAAISINYRLKNPSNHLEYRK